jgi:hypothetical protein
MDRVQLETNLEEEEGITLLKVEPVKAVVLNRNKTASGREIPSLNSFFE